MGNTFTHSMYSEREQRLVFRETPEAQEAQVPSNEKSDEGTVDTINLQSTDTNSIEAAATSAQTTAQETVNKFDADLKKTQNTDGSTTVDLNLKLTIPGAARIAELFKKFTSKQQESEQTTSGDAPEASQEQVQSDVSEDPANSSLAPLLEVAENVLDQITTEKNDESSTEVENQSPGTEQPEVASQANEAPEAEVSPVAESPESNESLEAQLKDALQTIQQQQEQINRLTQMLEALQARLDAPTPTAEQTPSTTPNREPLRGRSPNSNAESRNAEPAATEQRERILTPREALVQSARDAMGNDPSLSSDMSTLYDYFETNKNALPTTYEAMEDTQPQMYYIMADASSDINRYAFEVTKLDPKVVSDGRRSIQATPQGTFDFMKEVMMSGGSGMTRAPDAVSNAVRDRASDSNSAPLDVTAGRRTTAEVPAPEPANADVTPTTSDQAEEEKTGLDTQAIEGLKTALGTLANTVEMQADGNAAIDLSSAIQNPVAKEGISFILDALAIQHENGKIAVTADNIAAITAAAGKIVDYVQQLNSGNIAALPPEVSQKVLDAIDKQLPENMRGRLKLENANVVLDAGTALDGRLAKFAIGRANLEVKDGKLVIKPQDIAKAVALLTALASFFPERQEA